MIWIRKVIPQKLRPYFGGKRELLKSLGTKDQGKATPLFHAVMADLEGRIERARQMARGETPSPVFVMHATPEQQAAMKAVRLATPEGRIEAMTEKVERQLEQAGLTTPIVEVLTLDQLFEKWKAENKPSPNSEEEYARAKGWFKKLCGDKPIAEYTIADSRKYKEHVLAMTGHDGEPLAHATMVKNFSMVRTLFKYADGNEYLTANPFLKITIAKDKGKAKKRQEWDDDELKKLFASSIYTQGERPKAGAGEASYWIPVLGLYHGSRLGELCQLDRHDVLKRNGFWCFRMTDEEDKSLKTSSSKRYVPIHKRVIELGFLEYWKSQTGKKLFPKITPDHRGRWSAKWSKWFGRHRADLGLEGRFRDFHSFRHGWKTVARGAGIPEDHHDEITGHDNASVGRSYGSVPIPTLKREIDKIKFKVKIPKWGTH